MKITRRLILFAALAVAAFTVIGSAGATVCQKVDSPGDPYNGQCYHWPDTNRGDRTTVNVTSYGSPSGSWLQAIAVGVAQINSVYPYQSSLWNSNFACPNAVATKQFPSGNAHGIATCVGAYSYSCGDGALAQNWSACTQPFNYGEWYPAGNTYVFGPHLAAAETDYRTNNVDIYGNPLAWTQAMENVSTCHEIAGHGLGGDHTVNLDLGDPYKDVDPSWSSSCLAGINYLNWTPPTPQTLGSAVVGAESSYAAHNDSSASGYSNFAYTGKPVRALTLRQKLAAYPWLYAKAPLVSHAVVVTQAGLANIHKPAPVGTYYVVAGPVSADFSIGLGLSQSVTLLTGR